MDDFAGLPVETRVKVYIEILKVKKFVDFDLLSQQDSFDIHIVSDILNGLPYYEDYLGHRLLIKCSDPKKVYIFEGMNENIKNRLVEFPEYTLTS